MFTWDHWDKSLESYYNLNGQSWEGAANENNEVTGWDIEGLVELRREGNNPFPVCSCTITELCSSSPDSRWNPAGVNRNWLVVGCWVPVVEEKS